MGFFSTKKKNSPQAKKASLQSSADQTGQKASESPPAPEAPPPPEEAATLAPTLIPLPEEATLASESPAASASPPLASTVPASAVSDAPDVPAPQKLTQQEKPRNGSGSRQSKLRHDTSQARQDFHPHMPPPPGSVALDESGEYRSLSVQLADELLRDGARRSLLPDAAAVPPSQASTSFRLEHVAQCLRLCLHQFVPKKKKKKKLPFAETGPSLAFATPTPTKKKEGGTVEERLSSELISTAVRKSIEALEEEERMGSVLFATAVRKSIEELEEEERMALRVQLTRTCREITAVCGHLGLVMAAAVAAGLAAVARARCAPAEKKAGVITKEMVEEGVIAKEKVVVKLRKEPTRAELELRSGSPFA